MTPVPQWELRAAFARRLAAMYERGVPAYETLVEVTPEVNAEVVARCGDAAQRLGDLGRVTTERHAAIRVGTPRERARCSSPRSCSRRPTVRRPLRAAETTLGTRITDPPEEGP